MAEYFQNHSRTSVVDILTTTVVENPKSTILLPPNMLKTTTPQNELQVTTPSKLAQTYIHLNFIYFLNELNRYYIRRIKPVLQFTNESITH